MYNMHIVIVEHPTSISTGRLGLARISTEIDGRTLRGSYLCQHACPGRLFAHIRGRKSISSQWPAVHMYSLALDGTAVHGSRMKRSNTDRTDETNIDVRARATKRLNVAQAGTTLWHRRGTFGIHRRMHHVVNADVAALTIR